VHITIEKLYRKPTKTEQNLKKNMTRQWDQTANLKRSRRELSHCASRKLGGSGLKRPYKARAHLFGGIAKQRTSPTNIFGGIVTPLFKS